MSELNWQKSSFSGEGNNCLNIAAAHNGTIRLRESDAPRLIVTTTPEALASLIHDIRAEGLHRGTG